ncbi:hypothetical protein [Burkholderia vietnamiensis]|uniref:hypothetical protein n=1 Tax=Burkholderia vietnamiensis TaxID=60552 RepID=UPI0007545012|nr:hypothetical protein [Burkholderia vietnamiensis]KVF72724.1 hypothetical protein WJ17_01125 [Burkholderia vietnamiensis]
MNLAHFSSFGVAVAVYLIGTAMPGPGNLSIANASLNYGRMPGLATAAGVPLIFVRFTGVGRSSCDKG